MMISEWNQHVCFSSKKVMQVPTLLNFESPLYVFTSSLDGSLNSSYTKTGPYHSKYQTTSDLIFVQCLVSSFPFVVTMQCLISCSSTKRFDNYGCWSRSRSIYSSLYEVLLAPIFLRLSHSLCTIRFICRSIQSYQHFIANIYKS